MTRAYSKMYLNSISKNLGNMLHDAVVEYCYDGNTFLHMFIQSGIAKEIEAGNPKYLVGKSGFELFLDVVLKVTNELPQIKKIETTEYSDVYWTGWVLAHYQWYSGYSFEKILSCISYSEILRLYNPLHEADVTKAYDVFSSKMSAENALRKIKTEHNLTQKGLAEMSGVSVNTIRAYEHGTKSLRKAQTEIVLSLAKALKCDISKLLN